MSEIEEIIKGDRLMALDSWAKKIKADKEFIKTFVMSISQPEEMPFLLEKILACFTKLKKSTKDEVKNALIRVQIYCSINSNSDPIRVSKQLFIAQVLEKLFFGANILLDEEFEVEEKHEKKKKKSKK